MVVAFEALLLLPLAAQEEAELQLMVRAGLPPEAMPRQRLRCLWARPFQPFPRLALACGRGCQRYLSPVPWRRARLAGEVLAPVLLLLLLLLPLPPQYHASQSLYSTLSHVGSFIGKTATHSRISTKVINVRQYFHSFEPNKRVCVFGANNDSFQCRIFPSSD